MLTNWPQFFSDYPQHLGWGLGLICGAAVYFTMTGKFRKDSTLLLYLSLGWLVAFLAMPVLGSTLLMDYGGLRLMPPRSDDWAGIVGVFIAGLIWSRRHGLAPVSHVMSLGFILGGISFATVPMIRYLVRYPGHPWRFPDGVPETFAHFQSANWHSILEQSHGFGHGLAIAIAMAMLWRRQPYDAREAHVGGWTVAFSVFFAWFVIGFLNLHKLVETWVENGAVPPTLKAPLLGFIEASPLTWFCIVWWTAAAVCAVLLLLHQRRRLEIVPGHVDRQGAVDLRAVPVAGRHRQPQSRDPRFQQRPNGYRVGGIHERQPGDAAHRRAAREEAGGRERGTGSGESRASGGVAFARHNLAVRIGRGDCSHERLRLHDVGDVPAAPRRHAQGQSPPLRP